MVVRETHWTRSVAVSVDISVSAPADPGWSAGPSRGAGRAAAAGLGSHWQPRYFGRFERGFFPSNHREGGNPTPLASRDGTSGVKAWLNHVPPYGRSPRLDGLTSIMFHYPSQNNARCNLPGSDPVDLGEIRFVRFRCG